MNAYTKPFREDLGIDDAGFHRIRMGNTVYCVKDNLIYTLSADGQLTQVDESTLTAKSWIRRNVNEVLGFQKLTGRFIRKDRRGYVIDINGIQYLVPAGMDLTKNLDRNVFGRNAPVFYWSSMRQIKDGLLIPVAAEIVESLPFQTAVKSAVNPQRLIERAKRKHNNNRWHSRHECEQYKLKKNNTDAFGTTFK
ncbi:hypothetical protein [Acinetobacter tianfuensis]|uniref:Uncharacterized protein n=1 Tax=Acinetobacter tianfuensis TaxID=2419603 RepID=A0A3A8EFS5_9GAMM|nr:hypothetical protein [Acinetobacter tianfuensis]RKG33019.1 hypothetical protein D7V32_04275 [Acinetobacter tianfuensis]